MFGYGNGTRTHHSASGTDASGDRVKSVFDNRMAAHVWASQSQSFGRSGNGNFYFEGPALYSYGNHFVAGYILQRDKGGPVALLNADSYSVSTSRHQREAWSAVRHLESYSVPGLTDIVNPAGVRILEQTRRNGDGATAAEIRRDLRARMLANATEWADDSAVFFLTWARFRNPAATWATIQAERNKLDSAAKAKRDRITRDDLLAHAANAARTSPAVIAERLAEIGGNYNGRFDVERAGLRLYHAHRAAKAAGWKAKRVAKVWAAVKQARAAIAEIDRKSRVRAIRAHLRRLVTPFRAAIAKHASGESMSAHELDALQRGADQINSATWGVPGLSASLAATAAEARTLRDAMREKEERERFEKEAEKRRAWLAGESVGYWHGSDSKGGALLRVAGDKLQTSHGADVPLEHALKAFPMVAKCRDVGRTWTRNGQQIRVGHFNVDSIEADGTLRAGCHVIHWAEIERIAREVGIFNDEGVSE